MTTKKISESDFLPYRKGRKQTSKRQWLVLAIWYCGFIACLQFFRFKFGLFPISIAFMIIGVIAMLLFGGAKKSN